MSLIPTEGVLAKLHGCCTSNKWSMIEIINSLSLINNNARCAAPKFIQSNLVELFKFLSSEVYQLTLQISGRKTVTKLQTNLQNHETPLKHVNAVASKSRGKVRAGTKLSRLFG